MACLEDSEVAALPASAQKRYGMFAVDKGLSTAQAAGVQVVTTCARTGPSSTAAGSGGVVSAATTTATSD